MGREITRKDFLRYAQYSDGLIQLERRIKEHAAQNLHNQNYCANEAWYRTYKREVCDLVGWNADDIRLQSSAAYDTVYGYLYDLLPNCTCGSSICGLI